MFTGIDLFRGFPLARARELLQVARRVRYGAGERVIAQGSPGDAFYVIVSGDAAVIQGDEELKRYRAGDYFGETALLLDQPRNADVIAATDLSLVRIERYDFLYLLRGTDTVERLVRLARMREERSWELFEKNSQLIPLSSGQKTQLQSFLHLAELAPDEALWEAGEPAEAAYLLDTARVQVEEGGAEYGTGALLGDMDALLQGSPTGGTARVCAGGRAFRIVRADLVRWFRENPGLHLAFLGARAVD